MPSRIAVICATNRRNTGMLTVDLAAEQFFQHFPAEVTFFRSHVPDGKNEIRFAGQTFAAYRDSSQLADFDRIIFWGDFQNSLPYGRKNFAGLDRRYGPMSTPEESFARWRRLFLLEGYRRTPGQRVISVSNNFQGVGAAVDDLPAPVREELADLYAHSFDRIFPRDPESTKDLLQFAPDAAAGRVSQGLDAAFLLDSRSYASGTPSKVPYLRYFFGRSGFSGTGSLVAKAALSLRALPGEMNDWFEVDPNCDGRAHVGKQVERLTAARAVLTDTYHLCVNALNLGIPAVGIGRPVARQITAAGDFKKSVLFESLGLRDFYVDRAELDTEARRTIVDALRAAAAKGPAWKNAFALLASSREAYRKKLAEAIF